MSDALFQREFECPSCGGPIPQKTPGARTLVCPYCGQTSHLNADSLEAVGDKHLLIDYGSVFAIGQQLRFGEGGDPMLVLGRIRLDYADGFWDEWYTQNLNDGSATWLQEDDGQFVLFQRAEEPLPSLHYDSVSVGATVALSQSYNEVFITSKSKATVNGGEGELPFRIVPGEPADFVEGIHQGQVISVELLPDEKALFVGRPFSLDQVERQ
jgi:hypothetical protein